MDLVSASDSIRSAHERSIPADEALREGTSEDLIDLTVIVPAYKEAEALGLLLPILKHHVSNLTSRNEILIVDTEKPLDNTEDVCKQYGVTHLRRLGQPYGDAVRSGLQCARGRHILFMDADGSHNPADIPKLWHHRHSFDVVIGSRYVPGGKTENPKILIFLSFIVNFLFRLIFSLRCHDVSNSFRLYKSSTIKSVSIQSDNFDLIPEVLIKICRRYGAEAAVEVPITFEQRKKGESKRNLIAFAATYVNTIIRLRRITRN